MKPKLLIMGLKFIRGIFFLALVLSSRYGIASDDSYSAQDVLSFKRIDQVMASPDGKEVAYVVAQYLLKPSGKQRETSLYITDSNGKTSIIAKDNTTVSTALWSSDGTRIAFLAKGNKYKSIWVYTLSKNSVTKLIETTSDISSFKWSPDGTAIAFVADDIAKNTSAPLSLLNVTKNYKNSRIYLVATNQAAVLASPLTPGNYSVMPLYGNVLIDAGFDWSPDGHSIVFAHAVIPEMNYSNQIRLSIVDIKSRKTTDIPYTKDHSGYQPIYSPDGKWIAIRTNLPPSPIATALNNNSLLNNRICLLNTSTFEPTYLTNTFNESPGIIGWDSSSNKIFVMDYFKTEGPQIYSLSIDPHVSAKLISKTDGYIRPLTASLNPSHTIFGFGYETITKPPEAFISHVDSFKLQQISHIQSFSHKPLGNQEKINWKSKDGMQIEGLLITPQNYDAKKKYPLLVAIHGGPDYAAMKRYLGGCDENDEMILPLCFANLTSKGFVIFQPNYRGSTGYGLAFRKANFREMARGDYNDVITGLDYLVQKGVADPEHLAIFGWSYGGFLTSWSVGQTNRFKAAVAGGSLINLISFYGTTDIQWFLPQLLGKNYWDDYNLYLQRSPLTYAKNITTPLLILHGELDKRVPTTQSYELYRALRGQNKSAKMMILPQEAHLPTDANVIFDNINQVDAWLKKAL